MVKKVICAALCLVVLLWSTVINGDRSILGSWDASGATWTKPAKTGTTPPATCSPGEAYFETDATAGQNWLLCTSTNTWTAIVGGSGAPTNARYWVSEANGALSAETNLGALADNSVIAVDVSGPVATPRAALFGDVVPLWATGSCSGYLKSDGTCDTPSGGGGLGYSIQFGFADTSSSPADATTYYVGCRTNTTWTATPGGSTRCYIPRAGTVKAVYVVTRATTAGSSEQYTISFRLNDTSDTAISSTATVDQTTNVASNTSLNISVSQGDYFELKAVTPTWTTNPVNWFSWGVIYVE